VHIHGLTEALRELGAQVQVVAPAIASPDVGEPANRSWFGSWRRRLPHFVHELGELGPGGGIERPGREDECEPDRAKERQERKERGGGAKSFRQATRPSVPAYTMAQLRLR